MVGGMSTRTKDRAGRSAAVRERIRILHEQGKSWAAIGKDMGLFHGSVAYHAKRAGIYHPTKGTAVMMCAAHANANGTYTIVAKMRNPDGSVQTYEKTETTFAAAKLALLAAILKQQDPGK